MKDARMKEIAIAIISCRTYQEAAQKSGISVKTLQRIRDDPDFQSVLDAVQDQAFERACEVASGATGEAMQHLRDIAGSEKATASARVAAARALLEFSSNHYERKRIIDRIAALESSLGVIDEEL